MQRRLLLRAGVVSSVAASGPVAADPTFPNRPITVILPFPAGNQNDAMTRLIAQHLPTQLGQPVLIDYKTGASGGVGVSYVARAKPDGYTLVLSGMSSMVLAPSLLKKKLFDPINDFVPITRVGEFGMLLITRADLPVKDLADLIALAKEKPGTLNYGTIGAGSTSHIVAEMFKQVSGTNIVHVPYRTYPTTALLAGEIDMLFEGVGSAKPFVESGRVKALAVFGSQRSPLYPNLPCTGELGLQGLDVKVWSGFFAPAGTPQPVVDKLNSALVRVIRREQDIQTYLTSNGYTVVADAPEEFRRQMKSDVAFAAAIVDKLGLAQ